MQVFANVVCGTSLELEAIDAPVKKFNLHNLVSAVDLNLDVDDLLEVLSTTTFDSSLVWHIRSCVEARSADLLVRALHKHDPIQLRAQQYSRVLWEGIDHGLDHCPFVSMQAPTSFPG